MQIVVRYAKRGKDDRETIRQSVIPVRTRGPRWTFLWNEFVTIAQWHMQEGERIISITEAGYH